MRTNNSSIAEWTRRYLLGGVVLIAIVVLLWSRSAGLLWRNAVVLVPMAALVALICRWTPCRPATRHVLWLTLLVWLFAGAIFPPVSIETNTVRHEVSPSGSRGAAPRAVDSPPALTATRPRQNHEEPLTHRTKKSHTAPTSSEEIPEPSPARDHFTDAESWSALNDADVATQIVENAPGAQDADSAPTPPSTVARSKTNVPLRHISAVELAGQLSHLLRRLGESVVNVQTMVARWQVRMASADVMNKERSHGIPRIAAVRRKLAEERGHSEAELFSPPLSASDNSGASTGTAEKPGRISELWESVAGLAAARIQGWAAGLAEIRDAIGRLPPLPATVWITGFLGLVAMRIGAARQLRLRLRTAVPAPTAVQAEVAEIARTMKLPGPPRTVCVELAVSPMIWFNDGPVLILPRGLWRQLDSAGRRVVLCHELAHLKRRDHWIARVEFLIGAVYWWHPLVWWIRGRLREEAENCCDAWVTWLEPCGRKVYADVLIQTKAFMNEADAGSRAGAIGMASGAARRFARRLTMVMTRQDTPMMSRATVAMALAVVATGWLATPVESCDPVKEAKAAKTYVHVAPVAEEGQPTPAIAPMTPAPAVVAVEGMSPMAPMAAMTPMPASMVELAPFVAVGFDDRGPGASGDRELAQRVERLERQIERLTALLEGQGQAPSLPRTPQPGSPAARGRGGRMERSPGTPKPSPQAQGETFSKTYPVAEGKLEALLKLMSRDDVPPRVRGAEGGIELIGTADQHSAFEAFVDLIGGTGDTITLYSVPEGKLEALVELMVREDVPVFVTPGEGEISIHGNAGTQHVFKRFLEMINPGGAGQPAAIRRGAQGRTIDANQAEQYAREMALRDKELRKHGEEYAKSMAQREKELKKHSEEYAREMKKRGKEMKQQAKEYKRKLEKEHKEKHKHGKARGGAVSRDLGALQEAVAELLRGAEQLEAEADRLSDEADSLSDQASELMESGEGEDAQQQARTLEEQARELERSASELYANARQLETQSEELEAQADAMADELENSDEVEPTR
ncbi:MAG TPA: M56 family metallopeptidase [Phycisphaerae bacterium]|nr:M56 family metallopeptidase [Phycisphaerae bacterium]